MRPKIAEFNTCTACTACYATCKKKAIKMVADIETGFFYPQIDESKCILCGACEKICPINRGNRNVAPQNKAYALWDIDNNRRNEGSSGGMFGRLAENIINKGGVVFGAAFCNGVLDLECVSTDEVELNMIKKSKYVECNMKDSIHRIEQVLKQDRWVLFCGTPCEVQGVRAYFDNRFSKLIIVDFLCHGVPSQMAYEKYIRDTERHFGSQVNKISFRSKKLGWKTYCMYLKFQNGKEYLEPGIVDPYYRMYFRNYSYRPSCYSCDKVSHSEADITLGDFWGVTKIHSFDDSDEGISLVLVHTQKGYETLQSIIPNFQGRELKYSEYEYVYDNKIKNNKVYIDYKSFDYYNNDILMPLNLTARIKAFLFRHKLSRFLIYRK